MSVVKVCGCGRRAWRRCSPSCVLTFFITLISLVCRLKGVIKTDGCVSAVKTDGCVLLLPRVCSPTPLSPTPLSYQPCCSLLATLHLCADRVALASSTSTSPQEPIYHLVAHDLVAYEVVAYEIVSHEIVGHEIVGDDLPCCHVLNGLDACWR